MVDAARLVDRVALTVMGVASMVEWRAPAAIGLLNVEVGVAFALARPRRKWSGWRWW